MERERERGKERKKITNIKREIQIMAKGKTEGERTKDA